MKRSLLIGAAACAVAAIPTLSFAATPREIAHAVVTAPDNAVVLVHGDRARAGNATARPWRDRDDAWSRGLRRFRDTLD